MNTESSTRGGLDQYRVQIIDEKWLNKRKAYLGLAVIAAVLAAIFAFYLIQVEPNNLPVVVPQSTPKQTATTVIPTRSPTTPQNAALLGACLNAPKGEYLDMTINEKDKGGGKVGDHTMRSWPWEPGQRVCLPFPDFWKSELSDAQKRSQFASSQGALLIQNHPEYKDYDVTAALEATLSNIDGFWFTWPTAEAIKQRPAVQPKTDQPQPTTQPVVENSIWAPPSQADKPQQAQPTTTTAPTKTATLTPDQEAKKRIKENCNSNGWCESNSFTEWAKTKDLSKLNAIILAHLYDKPAPTATKIPATVTTVPTKKPLEFRMNYFDVTNMSHQSDLIIRADMCDVYNKTPRFPWLAMVYPNSTTVYWVDYSAIKNLYTATKCSDIRITKTAKYGTSWMQVNGYYLVGFSVPATAIPTQPPAPTPTAVPTLPGPTLFGREYTMDELTLSSHPDVIVDNSWCTMSDEPRWELSKLQMVFEGTGTPFVLDFGEYKDYFTGPCSSVRLTTRSQTPENSIVMPGEIYHLDGFSNSSSPY